MALHKNLTGTEAVHPFAIIAAADPGAIGAGKAWLNTSTTPHTLKYRNAANTGWTDVRGSGAATVAALAAVESASIEADAALDARVNSLEVDGAPPETHAATHASGGSDPVTLATSQVTGLDAALTAKAPLASPAFTGTPTAPTAAPGTNTTQLATTAFVLANAGAGGSVPVQKAGAEVVAAPTAHNYTGAGVTVTDVGGVATINVPGGGTPAWYKQEERTLGNTPGDSVELMQFATSASAITGIATLLVSLQFYDNGHNANYAYTIPISYDTVEGTGVWEVVRPDKMSMYSTLDRSGGRLEINISGGATPTVKLRAVREDSYTGTGLKVVATVLALGLLTGTTYTPLSAAGTSPTVIEYRATAARKRAVTRNITSTVGQYVEIGQWTGIAAGAILRVMVASAGTTVKAARTYLIAVGDSNPTGWREVTPIAQSTTYSSRGWALEAQQSGGTLSLRLASQTNFGATLLVLMELSSDDHYFFEALGSGAPRIQFSELSGTGTSTASSLAPWDTGDRLTVRNVTAAYTAGGGDRCVVADTTVGTFTVTLPSPTLLDSRGQEVRIKNKGTNALTVNGGGGQIDGAASKSVPAGTSIRVVGTGTDWQTV